MLFINNNFQLIGCEITYRVLFIPLHKMLQQVGREIFCCVFSIHRKFLRCMEEIYIKSSPSHRKIKNVTETLKL